jgi:hypothetical protein
MGCNTKTRAHQEGESIFIPVMDPQKRKTSLVNVPFVMDLTPIKDNSASMKLP